MVESFLKCLAEVTAVMNTRRDSICTVFCFNSRNPASVAEYFGTILIEYGTLRIKLYDFILGYQIYYRKSIYWAKKSLPDIFRTYYYTG